MFQTPARNAMATLSPVNSSGTDLSSVPSNAKRDPTEPPMRIDSNSRGEWPNASPESASRTIATAAAASRKQSFHATPAIKFATRDVASPGDRRSLRRPR